MAKLSKLALKEIVKECLVEILQEGLSSVPNSQQHVESRQISLQESSRSSSQSRSNRNRRRQHPALDSINYLPKDSVDERDNSRLEKNSNFDQNVRESVTNLTSDPVLTSIFEDTAKTTLQEQSGAEGRPGPERGSDAASMAVSENDLSDLFGDSASSKWADLAFSPKITT